MNLTTKENHTGRGDEIVRSVAGRKLYDDKANEERELNIQSVLYLCVFH
jgi:hypothetical protein